MTFHKKVSFITTVFNEEKTIIPFLQSLFKQTKAPDEIIIVDGGSKDKTIQKIEKYIHLKKKIHQILLIKNQGNRSVCRNVGIQSAKNAIIVCSDAGCILDVNWIKNIIKPFEKKVTDVVAGYYKGLSQTPFQKALVPYVLVMPDKVNPHTFLPSTRSIAFKKTVWQKIGGFDEQLSHNEDYVFAKKIRQYHFSIYFAKDAFVYWKPRKNLIEAYNMFFRFAYGDSEAGLFRPKVLLLFFRYLTGLFLLVGSITFQSPFLFFSFVFLTICYLFWSEIKNDSYVDRTFSKFLLPFIQIVSDNAVITGTIFGTWKRLRVSFFVKKNIPLILLIVIYSAAVLTGITWGIPNTTHPFSYHMDEWAQAQSIRALFKHGTANISGAAHGAVFQYFLSGIYLIPFIMFGIVNPFIIKSPFTHMEMQQKLFVLLRINTLLFGIGAIIMLAALVKRLFRVNPFIACFLFTCTPVFLSLSTYFKYDIALVFWIIVYLYRTVIFSENPTRKNFIIAGIIGAISLATKLSAVPILFSYVLLFFIFMKHPLSNKKTFLSGIIVFVVLFLLFGIPDFLVSMSDYLHWLHTNIIEGPTIPNTPILSLSPIMFLLQIIYAPIFGYVFFLLFIAGIVWFTFSSINNKKHLFIFITFLFFVISLIPLGLRSGGNRALVFLPFFALMTNAMLFDIKRRFAKKPYVSLLTIIFLCMSILQIGQTLSWIAIRVAPDPRDTSSLWITKHIPKGSIIGLENIPIFELIPNIALSEFYAIDYKIGKKTLFQYTIVDERTIKNPPFVIVTNDEIVKKYFPISSKSKLVNTLLNNGYVKKAVFTPNFRLFKLFYNTEDIFYFDAIISSPTSISVYEKKYAL
jgi:glycosyltransferase involved in cell wall biosynthesis